MSQEKPDEKYIKHGWLLPNERYNSNIHNMADKNLDKLSEMRQRNTNYNTTPRSQYYTEQDINRMHNEVKISECPICLEPISKYDVTNNNCMSCRAGHKFHAVCPNTGQTSETTQCPICRNTDLRSCSNNYDVFSGGKQYKKRKTSKRKPTKRKRIKRKTSKRKPTKRIY
jgi:hypothetical protein